MKKEELNLVLDALKWCHGGEPCGTAEAIAVVEKALMQEQEPTNIERHEANIQKFLGAPQQPEQEPVAFEMDWPDYHAEAMGCGLEDRNITDRYEAMQYGWDEAIERIAERLPEAFYITPPQRKPLTDEQREEIAKGWRGRNWTVGDIIDAIEAAHGIKE